MQSEENESGSSGEADQLGPRMTVIGLGMLMVGILGYLVFPNDHLALFFFVRATCGGRRGRRCVSLDFSLQSG